MANTGHGCFGEKHNQNVVAMRQSLIAPHFG
jgi:hypothetical protein